MTPVRFEPKVTSAQLGEVRHGTRGGRPDVRLLGGWFEFDSPDAALLVSLLPAVVHVRGAERLSVLVRLVAEESSERRSGRELVLTLVEVRLIDVALDAAVTTPLRTAARLADAHLASAMRRCTASCAFVDRRTLAKTAALSRSALLERFTLWACRRWNTCRSAHGRKGSAPAARRRARSPPRPVRLGDTFSTAFSRHGPPPARYARRFAARRATMKWQDQPDRIRRPSCGCVDTTRRAWRSPSS